MAPSAAAGEGSAAATSNNDIVAPSAAAREGSTAATSGTGVLASSAAAGKGSAAAVSSTGARGTKHSGEATRYGSGAQGEGSEQHMDNHAERLSLFPG